MQIYDSACKIDVDMSYSCPLVSGTDSLFAFKVCQAFSAATCASCTPASPSGDEKRAFRVKSTVEPFPCFISSGVEGNLSLTFQAGSSVGGL